MLDFCLHMAAPIHSAARKPLIAMLAAALAVSVASCRRVAEPAPTRPLILLAVDGADWRVVERLWQDDRLPHLEELAARGVAAPLETFHHASPVIWTTVATGVLPDVHGISEFVVPTARGDQPVASSLRRVPALWNMLTASERRVAVVGWWATWPVEEVNGVIISDRAVHEIPDRVWPPDRLASFETELAALRAEERETGPPSMLEADRVLARAAVGLAGEGYDLLLVYLRGVDISCHFHWRAVTTDAVVGADAGHLAAERELVFREYELVDHTLGELVAASEGAANVIVMSDHGFDALEGETVRIRLDFDAVLERLGFLTRDVDGVDFARTELFSYASPERSPVKKVRFALAGREDGGTVTAAGRSAIRGRLEAALATASYAGGAPAFAVRDAIAREQRQGADFVVEVLSDGARRPLMVAGAPLRDAILAINHLSGTHGRKTKGVFIAAGPDIDPPAEAPGLRVVDIPPTVLFALGLPVAEDFAGRARTEIFTECFRRNHPLRTIPTWGQPTEGENRASDVDEELLEQLRALGYIE